MCGIAGIFTPGNNSPQFEVIVQNILASQNYRGPDAQHLEAYRHENSQIVMGHNRLAIIDLSSDANQPMWDHSHRYCVVFNGMIYNFRELRAELEQDYTFHTNSDTEVLLCAFSKWGIDCCNKFNGMFAFAIYDRVQNTLHLVRDRFGIKPLYYSIKNNVLYFSSTSQQLAKELNLTINPNYLYHGLHSWCYENNFNHTPYTDLNLLPAGCTLKVEYQYSTIKTHLIKYYQFENRVLELHEKIVGRSVEDLFSLTHATIAQSISYRLIADVPIGISISGGVDSAVIAGYLASMTNKTIAFNYGHPDNKYSEATRVVKLSRYLNMQVEYVNPTCQQMIEAFWQCLFYQDAPFPNFSVPAQYLVYKTARQQGLKVLIGGQGGDETFMGYRKFLAFYYQELLKQKKRVQSLLFLTSLLPNFYVELLNVRNTIKVLYRYSAKKTKFTNLQLLQNSGSELNLRLEKSLIHRQITDVMHTSLPTLLRYEDRNSMGNSIESRLPFLDYQLVELAIALPTELKLKHGFGKWILREIGSTLLPKKYLFSRNKRGFDTQTARWINAGVGHSIRTFLHERTSRVYEFIEKKSNIDNLYSDNNLIHDPFLLHEAIILSWLVGKSSLC